MEKNFKQIEESVMAALSQLEERFRQQDERMMRLEGKLGWLKSRLGCGKEENMESARTDTEADLPSIQDVARPTEEQVFECALTCTGRTLREDVARNLARRFIRYYDARGWKNKDGETMTNWERALPRWVENSEKFHQGKGESIYEQEELSPTLGIGKPKLFGDTFSLTLHPSQGQRSGALDTSKDTF